MDTKPPETVFGRWKFWLLQVPGNAAGTSSDETRSKVKAPFSRCFWLKLWSILQVDLSSVAGGFADAEEVVGASESAPECGSLLCSDHRCAPLLSKFQSFAAGINAIVRSIRPVVSRLRAELIPCRARDRSR